jgi:Rho-binding antiterminator
MTDQDPRADYRPISCARYDEYEIAILHRQPLRLVWRDADVVHDRVVTPVDLQTHAGEEHLIARTTDGEQLQVRLDRIITSTKITPS